MHTLDGFGGCVVEDEGVGGREGGGRGKGTFLLRYQCGWSESSDESAAVRMVQERDTSFRG